MLKLCLLSIVLATLVVPVLTARARSPVRAFQAMVVLMVGAELLYALFLYVLYVRLVRWT